MNDHRQASLIAWKFLQKNRLAVLATFSSTKGTPQAAFIYYTVDDSFRIYFVTSKGSRKIVNISECDRVALVVGEEVAPQELQIEGTAEIVYDHTQKTHIIQRISQIANANPHSTNLPPLMKLSENKGLEFVAITITTFKYSDFSDSDNPLIIEGIPQDW